MFISLEGPEGSGKSGNAEWLASWLEGHGRPVVRVREPGGTPMGEAIRPILLGGGWPLAARSSLLLFVAARAELVERVIRPGLQAGRWVICDRFTDSTLAYQGYGEGIPLEDVRSANRIATQGLLPDLTILLDLDPEQGLRRRRGSAEWNAMDARSLEFHHRVRRGFLELAGEDPARWLVLDASRPLEVVRAGITAHLAAALALKP